MKNSFFLPNFFINLAYLNFNPEEEQIILNLHGWLDNANSFVPIAKELSTVNIYSLDLAGHGYSDHLQKGHPYNILIYVQHLIDLIETKKWKNLTIMAHSLGAGIATLLAGTIPDRISNLILIEGIGPLTEPPDNLPETLKEATSSYQRGNKTKLRVYQSIEEASELRSKKTGLDIKSSRIICERNLKKGPHGFVWRTDPQLLGKSSNPLTEEQVHYFLKKIECPVYLFLAKKGFIKDFSFLEKRIKSIKKIDIFEVEGHHHMHLQYPKKIIEKIEHLF